MTQTAKYKRGDLVAIINSTPSGKFFVESRKAVVVRQNPNFDSDSYDVIIDGDRVTRFVDDAAQTDPGAYVETMNARIVQS